MRIYASFECACKGQCESRESFIVSVSVSVCVRAQARKYREMFLVFDRDNSGAMNAEASPPDN